MSVTISFLANPEPDIDGYEIWRCSTESGTYELIVNVSEDVLSYTDETGTLGDWYKVRAYNTRGARGEFSPAIQSFDPPVCRVFGNLTDSSNEPLADATVSAKPQPRLLMRVDTGEVVADEVSTTTSDDGWWQLFLFPNDDLTPENSTYIFEFQGSGFVYTKEVIVPQESEVKFIDLEGKNIVV